MKDEQGNLALNASKRAAEISFLAESESMADRMMAQPEPGVNHRHDPDAWAKVFTQLTKLIGANSVGGSSVTDVGREREA